MKTCMHALQQIKKRDRGKHTRFKVLKAIVALGQGFHKGSEIREKFSELFPGDRFSFIYFEDLLRSYGLITTDQDIRTGDFQKKAKNIRFAIEPECFNEVRQYVTNVLPTVKERL